MLKWTMFDGIETTAIVGDVLKLCVHRDFTTKDVVFVVRVYSFAATRTEYGFATPSAAQACAEALVRTMLREVTTAIEGLGMPRTPISRPGAITMIE